jgi:very-short-patch-repair endonuclease
LDAPRRTRDRARALRKAMTLPEVLLWTALRKRQAGGLRFRRQHPIGPYVLDFYCEDLRIAVEVDGEVHSRAGHPERDARRDRWLQAQGVSTVRLPAAEVLRSPDDAASTVLAQAGEIAYLRHLQSTLSEWDSPQDAAFDAL